MIIMDPSGLSNGHINCKPAFEPEAPASLVGTCTIASRFAVAKTMQGRCSTRLSYGPN